MTDREQFDDIEELVKYLEKEYGITVLAIRDYGSRAWNLDSETSDMDAGMVFRQEPLDYVRLGGYTQNIDRKFLLDGEDFELIGWNIDRFAELLNGSNPSMIEWLNSGIRYYSTRAFLGARVKADEDMDTLLSNLRSHANENFKPIALWGHYRDMGKANYQKYIDNRNDLSVKRHLYILRGLLYARYVLETHRRPVLDFPEFVDEELDDLDVPDLVKMYTYEFIQMKKEGKGDENIADEELWDWMSDELDREIDHEEHNVRGIDRDKINDFIEKTVNAE